MSSFELNKRHLRLPCLRKLWILSQTKMAKNGAKFLRVLSACNSGKTIIIVQRVSKIFDFWKSQRHSFISSYEFGLIYFSTLFKGLQKALNSTKLSLVTITKVFPYFWGCRNGFPLVFIFVSTATKYYGKKGLESIERWQYGKWKRWRQNLSTNTSLMWYTHEQSRKG